MILEKQNLKSDEILSHSHACFIHTNWAFTSIYFPTFTMFSKISDEFFQDQEKAPAKFAVGWSKPKILTLNSF